MAGIEYYVLTFLSASDALAAERLAALCPEAGCTLIPLPPEISGDCGFALKAPELEPALSAIKGKVNLSGVYFVSGRGIERKVVKVS